MNRRELFVLAYYCLDAYWEECQSEELGSLCSDLNPFVWNDESSGDPACWIEFCSQYEDKEYTVEESYEIAKQYIKTFNCSDANKAFDALSIDDWQQAYSNLLENQS